MGKIVKAIFFTIFVFGLMGWLYIVAVALVHPKTLSLRLIHFATKPRDDTFGEVCLWPHLSTFLTGMLRDK